ncbi:transketolase, N-terminal subunit [Candidatus Uzinura diaspidicola str. ASNER]|uniref:Transketolase, N-terminal subunit n=1 Tax=Candidatus Uzinura diaspidicola str. ASNER TaxID=1133592 RepID=L7VK83_9FLAO|nr:transketolase, N-terminal subunit [Candidatus Uzinura diaspidicola str. ASNER]
MIYLKEISLQTRRDILRMIHNAKSGHPGGSLGSTEYFIALFYKIMSFQTKKIEGKEEDMFFLSNGHISAVLYSVLARKGYFSIDELTKFRTINSRLQGHPSVYEKLPGIHVASGSLGQGMSVALGAAQAKTIYNDSYLSYSYHGDGEINEGQNWEAILYAGAKKVDNYIATIDYNHQQIDGNTDKVMHLGNIKMKFESFGWQVLEETKGNCINSVIKILQKAKKKAKKGKPICIILHTEMGHGVDFMNGSYQWHGKSPNDEELKKALHQLPETIGDYDK